MAKKEPSEMTLEELIKVEKSTRTGAIIIGVCIAVMLIAGVYTSITKGKFSMSLVTPVIFLAILLPGIQNHKKIKAELKQRQ